MKSFAMTLTAFLLAACGGGPRPGDPGYAYNVMGVYSGRLVVEGESFDAELDLAMSRGGRVRGSFRVRQPLAIDGRAEGTIIDNLLRLTVTYGADGRPACDGRVEGILTIQPGGALIEGPVTVADCDDALGGRMTFRR